MKRHGLICGCRFVLLVQRLGVWPFAANGIRKVGLLLLSSYILKCWWVDVGVECAVVFERFF